jgi:hypothetical protein
MGLFSRLEKTVRLIETGELTAIFAAAIKDKWYESFLLKDGPFLFSLALFLNAVQFGVQSYRYYQARNKNINETEGFIWTALKSAAIAVALVGFLVSATTFVVVTSLLLFGTFALDTLRNFGLTVWNAAKLLQLNYVYSRKKDQTSDDLKQLLDEQKVENLRQQYWAKIKTFGRNALIGAFVTNAAAFLFLFPHIGLGTLATKIIIIGSLKTTAAGLAALAAVAAVAAPLVFKAIKATAKLFWRGIAKSESVVARPILLEEVAPRDKIVIRLGQERILEKLKQLGARDQLVEANHDYNLILNHDLDFNAHTKNTKARGLIFKNIPDDHQTKREYEQSALKLLHDLVFKKRQQLNNERTHASIHPELLFAENQSNLRSKKMEALDVVLKYLNGEAVYSQDENGRPVDAITTTKDLLQYIKEAFPEVDVSFWKEKSDTRDVLKAVKEFGKKFPTQAELVGVLPQRKSLVV